MLIDGVQGGEGDKWREFLLKSMTPYTNKLRPDGSSHLSRAPCSPRYSGIYSERFETTPSAWVVRCEYMIEDVGIQWSIVSDVVKYEFDGMCWQTTVRSNWFEKLALVSSFSSELFVVDKRLPIFSRLFTWFVIIRYLLYVSTCTIH